MSKHFILSLLLTTVSCVTSDIRDLEQALNSDVGKEFKGNINGSAGWKKITTNPETVELEQKRNDGCSYAYLIDSKTKMVLSWRYTSTREECNLAYFKTGA